MERPEAVFLGVWFPGLALLISGVYLTRRHWRADVPPYPDHSPYVRVCDIVLHPGRYAYPRAARLARILTLAGTLLLGVGLLAVVYGLASAIQH